MEVLIAVNAMEADTLRLLPLGLLSRRWDQEGGVGITTCMAYSHSLLMPH